MKAKEGVLRESRIRSISVSFSRTRPTDLADDQFCSVLLILFLHLLQFLSELRYDTMSHSPSPGPSNNNNTTSAPGTANHKHALTAVEKQRSQLERLLKDPSKPAYIPSAPKDKQIRPPREMMKNVQGSSAGAGSGEFHVYKAARRREYERLKMLEEASEKVCILYSCIFVRVQEKLTKYVFRKRLLQSLRENARKQKTQQRPKQPKTEQSGRKRREKRKPRATTKTRIRAQATKAKLPPTPNQVHHSRSGG
jgi:hypothetical protein